MNIKYHIACLAMLGGLFAACTSDEPCDIANNSDIVVIGHILPPANGQPSTRTEIDNNEQETNVHTLWVPDDQIGIFNSATGSTNSMRLNKLYNANVGYSSTTDAEFTLPSGDNFKFLGSKFWYAYYPYESSIEQTDISYGSYSNTVPDGKATVTWTLPAEQDWYNYASIASRDWMVSKATTNSLQYKQGQTRTVCQIIFRPITTLLRFMVTFDEDAMADNGLSPLDDIVSITVEPASTQNEADFPYLTGQYTFDLKYLDRITDEKWNLIHSKDSYIDELSGIWPAVPEANGSKKLILTCSNVSTLNTPTRAYANIAPVLNTNHKVKVTITTKRLELIYDNLGVQKEFKAGKVYTIPLHYTAANANQWTLNSFTNGVEISDDPTIEYD